jgi:hypothetical protein
MTLTAINNFSAGTATVNAVDVSSQVVSFDAEFSANEIRSVTLGSEPYGKGFKGELRCVVALVFEMYSGTGNLCSTLGANPFNLACVFQWAPSCTVTGSFNFPNTRLPRPAGSAIIYGNSVGTSNGSFVLAWA